MIATVANMRKCEAAGIRAIAYDPTNGDEYSATPGDYFWLGDNPLTGEDGNPLILVRRVTEFVEIGDLD